MAAASGVGNGAPAVKSEPWCPCGATKATAVAFAILLGGGAILTLTVLNQMPAYGYLIGGNICFIAFVIFCISLCAGNPKVKPEPDREEKKRRRSRSSERPPIGSGAGSSESKQVAAAKPKTVAPAKRKKGRR